jgi:predicted ATPase/class 3 adenylate cyclase
MTLPTGTVTFLLTDVEGSTRAWERDRAAMAEAVARHYEILDAAIAGHGGVRPEEQGEGDSVVAAFTRASDAVAAAIDAQTVLARETDLAVRMALHTGEIELRDEKNYTGPTIIRTARLRALAHGGQIVVSSTTADMVADRLPAGATLVHVGTHRLKDLTRPERVFQLTHPDLRADFPLLLSVDRVPNNLPLQHTTFIGRDAVMAELGDLLDQQAIVTLTGAGGSGKTRLAIHVAAERLDQHADGLWLVDLGPVNDPGLVPNVVAAAMGVPELPIQPLVETLVQRLEPQDALLILDNCEHLLDACVVLTERLLRSCVRLTILATSREPLGIDGEAVLRLPSLEVPADASHASAEAFRLFVDRATLARSTFHLDDEGAVAVVEVCRRLDGIPLAIELAAARCRALSPQAIASQLSTRFALVAGGRRGALPRQRTLEASVEWSSDLLADPERTLLQRLAVFAGSFTLGAAEAVCSDDELPQSWIVEGLTGLVDKSLVQLHD